MHAPKATRYDLRAKTHSIDRGSYSVDRFEQGDGWLYLARPHLGHSYVASMEAYLLPALGLQVGRWEHHPGSKHAWCDFYFTSM